MLIRVHVDFTVLVFTPCIDVLDSMWVQLQTCIPNDVVFNDAIVRGIC